MPFDVNQETITPRVSHFAAELNVENLCGKQTTQLKVLIVNPYGRIDSHRGQNFILRALNAGFYVYFHKQSIPWEIYDGSSNI